MRIRNILYIGLCLAMMGCSGPSVPEVFTESKDLPKIYPDYTNVTIPMNIAPLTFELDEVVDEMIARYAVGDKELVFEGKAQPQMDDWRLLTEKAKGGAMTVDVYARRADQWTHYKPFNIFVSPDSIDSYLSYRLIYPSFVDYKTLTISQRCLENYDESVIYDNVLCGLEKDRQCINCHSYQQYNPERMQFHARQNFGGTIIAYDGHIKKVDMKNDSILSAGVYPAWHPWLKLIVYSTNMTAQSFHTTHHNKIEVYDSESDLIAYDIDKGEVTNLENDANELEVFPAWAPDGKTLYYCSAHFEWKDSALTKVDEIIKRSQEIKYNIYRKRFNPETMAFGPRELVFSADSLNKSATLPRISPDGRYLMFALAEYGVFHIWHHDADLWLLDLQTGQARALQEINSPDTESYHSWSSNGKWVVFSSRRDDGTYTRPFFAHIDNNGHGTKPFELPSADPDYHRQFMRCYNIPEFMHGPVTTKPQTFAEILKGEGTPVKYVQKLTKSQ
ncbi:MAG: PD40 domain-containing protein [Prevotella sp.]|nr:PD40 domain-containing protein [Prevotella sp.]